MPLITVSGTQKIGKSTFIKDFLANWPMFKTPERTYRDIIKERGLKINKETTKETQRIILDAIIESMESYSRKNDYIIFDRCPLDNLVYSLWAAEKGKGDIDDEFLTECIQKSRLALQRIDLMLLIPISEQNKIDDDESNHNPLRETDEIYRKEINEIFQGLRRLRETGDDVFFVKDDCSPIIEIFGSPQERIEMMKLYLKEDGSFFGDEDSLLFDGSGNSVGMEGEEPEIYGDEKDQLKEQLGLSDSDMPDDITGIVRPDKDKYDLQ